MGRYYLRRVSLGGFRSFQEPQRLELPRTGMMLVDCQNRDTGGRSASGKSNLGLAISQGFDYCPFPATTFQSWTTKQPYWTEYELETDAGLVTWRLGDGAFLKGPGLDIQGATSAIRQAIQAYTGLDPKVLGQITYREQRTAGAFLAMSDSEKKKFLTTLLGLGKYEEQADASEKAAEEAARTLAAAEGALAFRRQQAAADAAEVVVPTFPEGILEAMVERHAAAAKACADMAEGIRVATGSLIMLEEAVRTERRDLDESHKDEVDRLAKQAEVLRGQTHPRPTESSGEMARLTALLGEVQRRRKAMADVDEVKKATVRAEAQRIEKQLRPMLDSIATIPSLEVRKAEKLKERGILEQSLCPTCERPWLETQKKILAVTIELEDLYKRLKAAEETRAPASALEVELTKWRVPFVADPAIGQLDAAEKQVWGDMATERQRLASEFERSLASHRAEVAQAGQELEVARRRWAEAAQKLPAAKQLVDAKQAIERARQELAAGTSAAAAMKHGVQMEEGRQEAAREAHARAAGRAAKASAAVKEAEGALEAVRSKAAAELDFHAVVGRAGFLGLIFDEVLEEVADDVNRAVARVPNVAQCTVKFPSSREVKSTKNVRKEIRAMVTVDGHEGPYRAVLSGGMISAFELAVDLAVGGVVSRRTGSFPGWMWLDEALGGLSAVEMEACLAVLSKYAEDRLILVVEHASEFREMFSRSIKVVKEGGRSRIE